MFAGLVVDRHSLAAITLVGMVLDVVGGLYLAYDLLGRQSGVLRFLTRIATNGSVLGSVSFVVSAIHNGVAIGLLAGIAIGGLIGMMLTVMNSLTFVSPSSRHSLEVERFRPLFTREYLIVVAIYSALLTVVYTTEGAVGSNSGDVPVIFALSLATAVSIVCVLWLGPLLNWWIDYLPARRLGVIGAMLLLAGFAVQSLQYLAVVFNMTIR